MSISDFENQAPEGSGTEWTNQESSSGVNSGDTNPAPQATTPFDQGTAASDAVSPSSTDQPAAGVPLSQLPPGTAENPTQTVTITPPTADAILATVLGRITDIGEKPHFKLMVIGPPGQGKSSLAISATNALIYDFEDGLARAKASPLGVGPGTQAIPYINMDEFRTLVGALMAGNPALSKYEVFGVDTLSDLHKRDLAEITERDWRRQPSRNRYVPETEQYTEVNERIVRVVRALRDLPLNIIITSHSKTVEPKGQPASTYADFSESLSNKVMAMMDMVGYLQKKKIDNEVKTVLRFQTDGVIRCKAPSFMPDEIVSPTYDDIRRLWEEGVKNK